MKNLFTPIILLVFFSACPLPLNAAEGDPAQPADQAAPALAAHEVQTYKDEFFAARTEASRAKRDLESLRKEYDAWKTVNARTIEIKNENDRLEVEKEGALKEAESLKAELKSAQNRKNIYSFLAGGGVFLIGMLVGSVIAGGKNRSRAGGYRF